MKNLLLMLFLAVALTACGGSKESTKKKEETTVVEEEKIDDSAVNKEISDRFYMDLGWATGKLDSDGNEVENGTPNPDYVYSLFINKIEYNSSDDQLSVYVNKDFNNLIEEDKKTTIGRAQSMASPAIPKYEGTAKKPFVVVLDEGKQIGSSEALNTSEFKFDK